MSIIQPAKEQLDAFEAAWTPRTQVSTNIMSTPHWINIEKCRPSKSDLPFWIGSTRGPDVLQAKPDFLDHLARWPDSVWATHWMPIWTAPAPPPPRGEFGHPEDNPVPRISPGKGYRFVLEGEYLREDDEVFGQNFKPKVMQSAEGGPVGPTYAAYRPYGFYRRRLSAEIAPGHNPAKLTVEQVGTGYELFTPCAGNCTPIPGLEMWRDGRWARDNVDGEVRLCGDVESATYRILAKKEPTEVEKFAREVNEVLNDATARIAEIRRKHCGGL